MPSNDQAPWIMLFMTFFVFLATELTDYKILPLYKQPYTAKPAITYEYLTVSSKRFRKWTNFEFDIFYQYFLKPLSKYVDQVRSYYPGKPLAQEGNNNNNVIDPRTRRGCVLNVPTRIIRYITILKGETMSRIETLFDQDRTTAMRDFIHINVAVMHCFANKYLKRLKPGTVEFNNSLGAGCLSKFPNAIGIFDITKVCMFVVLFNFILFCHITNYSCWYI